MNNPSISVATEMVPSRIFKADIKLYYLEGFMNSPDREKIQASINDTYEGWGEGDGWEDLLKQGVFRYNKSSNSLDTKLSLSFEKNGLCVQVDQSGVHVNFLLAFVNMLISRHETNSFDEDHIKELGVDIDLLPKPGKSSDRIQSVEISNIFGSEKLVSSEFIANSKFIPRTNVHLEFSPQINSSFSEKANEMTNGFRLQLAGPENFNYRDQRKNIELFEDAESAGFFDEIMQLKHAHEGLLEIFSSLDSNIILDDFLHRFYHVSELLNLLEYDHSQQIMLEFTE